jgi:hypothetical protein
LRLTANARKGFQNDFKGHFEGNGSQKGQRRAVRANLRSLGGADPEGTFENVSQSRFNMLLWPGSFAIER